MRLSLTHVNKYITAKIACIDNNIINATSRETCQFCQSQAAGSPCFHWSILKFTLQSLTLCNYTTVFIKVATSTLHVTGPKIAFRSCD